MQGFRQFLTESELTLKYHDELNPNIWSKDQIKDAVRQHLLKIAEQWRVTAKIPKSAIKNILLTGGNANYNYTKFSDLDVHLLVDKKLIADCDKEILDDYLKDKKSLWTLTHDIKIYGLPVELYAQDISEKTSSNQGVYSLKDDRWITKPKKEKVNLADPILKRKIASLKHTIDMFINQKCEDLDKMNDFKEKLRKMRSAAIERGGEFSLENLAFKELRNLGYLDKFSDYIKHFVNLSLSLG
jgi:hypothetical protein